MNHLCHLTTSLAIFSALTGRKEEIIISLPLTISQSSKGFNWSLHLSMWIISVTNFFCPFLFSTRNLNLEIGLWIYFQIIFLFIFILQILKNISKNWMKLHSELYLILPQQLLCLMPVLSIMLPLWFRTFIPTINLSSKPCRAINVTTTEAELFAIYCGINQVVANSDVNYIVIITNSLHTAKRIFDSSVHLYQIHLAVISQKLREFFSKNSCNYIKFWDCPSKQKWLLYYSVDKDTKRIVFYSIVPL